MPINKMKDKNGKLIKKDGKQKYRVRVNYVDDSGQKQRIERIVYGLDEAKQLERELLYSVKQKEVSKKISLSDLYQEYITAKKHEVRESSLTKSIQVLTRHVLPYFPKVKLDKLTIPLLQKWKQKIEDLGLSLTMRKNIYKEFRAMMNYAVKMEYIPNNILLKVGNFKAPLEAHKEMSFYTPEEFKLYIATAKYFAEKQDSMQSWNYYVFFYIAFFTGMRKGEIHALTWEDIKDNEIHITKSLTQKLKGEDKITPPKNKSSIRTIQIPNKLQKVLHQHFERCQNISGFSPKMFVCGGTTPLRDTSIDNANRRFAEVAGVKHIRIHDFRHSHASLLANNGINIQEIARRLGHSDIKTTLQTYSHLYPKESERAVTVLENIDI